jgi:hypothetical protein
MEVASTDILMLLSIPFAVRMSLRFLPDAYNNKEVQIASLPSVARNDRF